MFFFTSEKLIKSAKIHFVFLSDSFLFNPFVKFAQEAEFFVLHNERFNL